MAEGDPARRGLLISASGWNDGTGPGRARLAANGRLPGCDRANQALTGRCSASACRISSSSGRSASRTSQSPRPGRMSEGLEIRAECVARSAGSWLVIIPPFTRLWPSRSSLISLDGREQFRRAGRAPTGSRTSGSGARSTTRAPGRCRRTLQAWAGRPVICGSRALKSLSLQGFWSLARQLHGQARPGSWPAIHTNKRDFEHVQADSGLCRGGSCAGRWLRRRAARRHRRTRYVGNVTAVCSSTSWAPVKRGTSSATSSTTMATSRSRSGHRYLLRHFFVLPVPVASNSRASIRHAPDERDLLHEPHGCQRRLRQQLRHVLVERADDQPARTQRPLRHGRGPVPSPPASRCSVSARGAWPEPASQDRPEAPAVVRHLDPGHAPGSRFRVADVDCAPARSRFQPRVGSVLLRAGVGSRPGFAGSTLNSSLRPSLGLAAPSPRCRGPGPGSGRKRHERPAVPPAPDSGAGRMHGARVVHVTVASVVRRVRRLHHDVALWSSGLLAHRQRGTS